jgi:hypothetical protein
LGSNNVAGSKPPGGLAHVTMQEPFCPAFGLLQDCSEWIIGRITNTDNQLEILLFIEHIIWEIKKAGIEKCLLVIKIR